MTFFSRATFADVERLLNREHYIGSQCADPSYVFVEREPGGLFGNCGEVVAAAVFAPPASFAWGKAIELIRLVREPRYTAPLSGFLSRCAHELRLLRKWEIIVAYADPEVGHHGGVYQARSWIFVGYSSPKVVYVASNGRTMSQRSYDQRSRKVPLGSDWMKRKTGRKLTYVFPLNRIGMRRIGPRRKPYLKPREAAAS